ncbi:MAG: MarP family serine protease [Actinomycetota bacterium]
MIVRPWDDTALVSFLDLALLGVLLLAALLGFRRGAVLQLFTYGGLLLGLIAGAALAPLTAGTTTDPAGGAGIAVTTLLIAGAIGDLVGWIVGGWVRSKAHGTVLGRADRAGGSFVAVIAVVLAIWVVALNLVNGPLPLVASEIRRSAVVRSIDELLPDPPSLLTQAQRWFNSLGFPDVFSGIPPVPSGPVSDPPPGVAGRALRAADESTVRVVGEACELVLSGSGFVAGDGLVVTNAHVVAGERSPRVETSAGTHAATPVVFDPRLDLAILRVASRPGPVLDLTTRVARRSDGGAVVGYPGGGDLQAEPAAVRGSIEAVGPDLYGQGRVRRSLLELQTSVVPGNSGGPFVLGDGQVAGVVVSASTTDEDLGYAVAAEEVHPLVERAATRTAAVSTGPCLR